MQGPLGEVFFLLIRTLGGVLLFAILARFLLQAARADFYNPVTQSLVKLTNPVLAPFHKVIPGFRGLDFSALVAALLLNSLCTALLIKSAGFMLPSIGIIVSWSFVGILSFILDIYFFGLLISIIASWVAPYSGNPVLMLIHQLIEPIQSRFRRVIPPLGGLDFSPIFIFLAIQVVEIMVVQPFAAGLRLNPNYVLGI